MTGSTSQLYYPTLLSFRKKKKKKGRFKITIQIGILYSGYSLQRRTDTLQENGTKLRLNQLSSFVSRDDSSTNQLEGQYSKSAGICGTNGQDMSNQYGVIDFEFRYNRGQPIRHRDRTKDERFGTFHPPMLAIPTQRPPYPPKSSNFTLPSIQSQ